MQTIVATPPATGRGFLDRARVFATDRLAYLRQVLPAVAPVRQWHRLRGRQVVVCLGDSHLEPMWLVQRTGMLPRTRLAVLAVGGATASGAQNPNSRTNAFTRWLPLLRRLDARTVAVSCLGEVDVGFLVFTRDDPDAALASAVERYQKFLQEQVHSRGARLLVLGVVPPIIEDYADWAGPRGQKRDVDASWAERAGMTRRFNSAMAAWCTASGAVFVDLAAQVSGPDGRVLPALRHADAEDHHLDADRAAELFAAALRSVGCR